MEKGTVLFVDDEEKSLSSIKRAFLGERYEILFTNSVKEAIEILKQNQVHVLVTDMRMPAMSGEELLGIVKEDYPHIVRIAFSAYIDTLLSAVDEQEVFKYITKSSGFTAELKAAVREALDYYNRYSERDRPAKKLEQHNPNFREKV